MKTYEEMLEKLTPAQRKKVQARAKELIAEEKSLRDLRQAIAMTQTRVAQELGISQDQVSKLENRSDLLLSTLRSYIEAMGGKLQLIAEFPGRPAVLLAGLVPVVAGRRVPRRKR